MLIKTRIFEFCNGSYKNLSELAQAMGISVSQVYRVREGKRSINQKFIIGAIEAFPKRKFEDLFYLAPEHYTIQAAAKHDYVSFYDKEIAYRRQLHNPPFTRLACLTYSHTNDTLCQREAERMKCLLIEERNSKGVADLSLIGPAPAFIHRLRGRFRWQLILRGAEPSAFLSQIPIPQGWTVDIDPASLI